MLVQMPMSEPGPLAQPGEEVREVVRVYRRVHLTGEDQPVILPQETISPQLLAFIALDTDTAWLFTPNRGPGAGPATLRARQSPAVLASQAGSGWAEITAP